MIEGLLRKIKENIKSPELADGFLPDFSTTTEKYDVCAAATAMEILQAYIKFTMGIECLRGLAWEPLRCRTTRMVTS